MRPYFPIVLAQRKASDFSKVPPIGFSEVKPGLSQSKPSILPQGPMTDILSERREDFEIPLSNKLAT